MLSASTLASARLHSSPRSSRWISSRRALCRCSFPIFTRLSKLTRISLQEYFRFTQNPFDERVSFPRLSRKLLPGVNGRIDLPTQRFDGRTQRLQQLCERHGADDHDVDIARSPLLASRDGTVNESRFHRVAKRRKPRSNQCRKPSGLGKQALQLREYRVRGIRLEPDSGAVGFAQQQSKIDQGLQLAMRGTGTGPRLPLDLAQMKPLIRVPLRGARRRKRGRKGKQGGRSRSGLKFKRIFAALSTRFSTSCPPTLQSTLYRR